MQTDLIFAIDAQFEPQAAVALCSFLIHNEIPRVLVVTPRHCKLSLLPAIAKAFDTELEHKQVRDDSPLSNLPAAVSPYFYCVEALDLAESPGRYLYVDADTLCVSTIEPLKRLTLTPQRPIAACSHGRPMVERALVLNLQSSYHYFNAGVLLFDAQYLKEKINCRKVVEYFLANSGLCRFREQCALNALLRDQVQYLPMQYNLLSWMRERQSGHNWHSLSANEMADSISHAREDVAIAHLSAGAHPDRLPQDRIEPLDRYWLEIRDHLSRGRDPRDLRRYQP